jgi:hypothetical protein
VLLDEKKISKKQNLKKSLDKKEKRKKIVKEKRR